MFWNTLFYNFEKFHILFNKERKVWYVLVLRRHWLFKKWVRKFYLSDKSGNPKLYPYRSFAYNDFMNKVWKNRNNNKLTNFDNLHKLNKRITKW